jgi:hypothetical protein
MSGDPLKQRELRRFEAESTPRQTVRSRRRHHPRAAADVSTLRGLAVFGFFDAAGFDE